MTTDLEKSHQVFGMATQHLVNTAFNCGAAVGMGLILWGMAVKARYEPAPTFEEAWAKKEAEGYQYGHEALDNVRFGWEIANGKL